ncbi:DUF1127 domain-containing protein [Thalassospira tepidiphila]|jgi:uncharacterized protein YjiS (DUF1127 family)|uniref:DUF1127 domain-containing protein n=1 Tax=Thalassospira tepidiphila TaxID=393657 RepID=UPI001BCAD1C1|nr:DUF1127 domain-containing protein [Thalassospira tepidiphila]MBS8272045.1 DUF1127 domain-containing protein [Thalassospira tepidiphila]
MAVSNHIKCHPVVGQLSNKSSSEMLAQCLSFPASRPHATRGICAIIPTILDALIVAYKRCQGRNALDRLSDDQLRDIGLERTRDGYETRGWY